MEEQTNEETQKVRKPRKTKLTEGCLASPNYTELRNRDGLVNGIEYPKDSYGFVQWRKLINPDHVILNKNAYSNEGIVLSTLTQDELAKLKAEATDDKLLIKLAGFRDLARLRGFTRVIPSIVSVQEESVVCDCTIEWLPNYETSMRPVTTKGVASANFETVTRQFRVFLEQIASNRAFARCVREFLGIFSPSEEEMNPNERVEVSSIMGPVKYLEKICNEKNIDFITLLKFLSGAGIEPEESWTGFSQIPVKIATSALGLLQDNK